ncbi:hypothetical protein [Streptomyces sp. NPDC037389]|uniref:hypothetical protein n=1 Tax=Streptomyces sp. NPDC037389 TaxID=3155369 RepID=UPI0033F46C2D
MASADPRQNAKKDRLPEWVRGAWASCRGTWRIFTLSRFRKLALYVIASSVLVVGTFFVWLGTITGYVTAYEILLGLTSPFGKATHGALQQTLAAILRFLGWLALPTLIGLFAAQVFARRLAAIKDPNDPLVTNVRDLIKASGSTPGDAPGEE